MIDRIKTAQGVAAIVASIFATMVAWWNLGLPASCSRPSWHRFTAGSRLVEPFDRDTRLLLLDQTLVATLSVLGRQALYPASTCRS